MKGEDIMHADLRAARRHRLRGLGSPSMAREIGQSLAVLALTGSSVGGFLGMLAVATRVLGR
jgi:hypothetical protein